MENCVAIHWVSTAFSTFMCLHTASNTLNTKKPRAQGNILSKLRLRQTFNFELRESQIKSDKHFYLKIQHFLLVFVRTDFAQRQWGCELQSWPPKEHNPLQECVFGPSGTRSSWHTHSALKTELLPLLLLSVLLKAVFHFLPLFTLEINMWSHKIFKTVT